MGLWNYYFITKLFLYLGNYIDFHVWVNLAFATFLAIPIPKTHVHSKRLSLSRQVIAVPAGIALLYYDTWLPPITRIFTQSSQLGGFSTTYLMELIGRFINPMVVAGLVLLYVICFFVQKKFRLSSFVFLFMLMPLISTVQPQLSSRAQLENAAADTPSPVVTDASLTGQLNAFYSNEAARAVSFMPPPKADAPFDIIFLQVCSLSWDDLEFAKQRDNPFLKRFDIVYTNFNSAASYSGPAAIRLLRGSCGQPSHKSLYEPAQAQCLTLDNLKMAGFDRQLLMNHDGRYGDFLNDVRERGGLNVTPFEVKGLPAYLQSFDGSPVHDDYEVLSKWWGKRLQLPTERVALYYNTVSLHDGNYYSSRNGDSRRPNSMEIYPRRLTRLLDDMDRFFSVLQASGRHAVVVLLAEHGASVRGDKMQIAGMREIPTPLISTVPVGIKLIGLPDQPDAKPVLVTKPTSYLAISQLLANFLTITPFGKSSLSMDDYVRDLPATEFVAQNEDVVVMLNGKQYYILSKGASWVEYDASK
ncbi:MAG: cellulose biosynthesis protein BcsG [Gallionellaceae bacterium]|nr:MAG: cellulose biosynthesis protein BcsG [Gallionellaceae bacterium]